jgi:hypothetical protein
MEQQRARSRPFSYLQQNLKREKKISWNSASEMEKIGLAPTSNLEHL